jgi:hypothetical protein
LLGGSAGPRTEYIEQGLQSLAASLAGTSVGRQIYCDVVSNNGVNAYVALEKDVYLIGITLGVLERVFDRIRYVLQALDIKDKGLKSDRYDSFLQELQYSLHFWALTFIVGHECGHINRGHIDNCLNIGQMSSEVEMTTSQREEMEADTTGALSMIFAKSEIYRLCELTDAATAVGLLQVPLACVFTTLFLETHQSWAAVGYPNPIVRLFIASRTVLNFMSVFATDGAGLSDEEMAEAQGMMTTILRIIDPKLHNYIMSNVDMLKSEITEMQKVADPIVSDWMNNSWQFMAFDRTLEARRLEEKP